MNDCLFCKIVDDIIPSTKVYEDEYVYAFNDISPQAPVHIIIIPKKHYDNILQVNDSTTAVKIFDAVQKIVEQEKIENGFRLVCNTGKDGGQTVEHLHFHLLGKRQLQWPPG